MKIALIGYGKMGKAIETIALERGHEIVAKITSSTPLETLKSIEVDVAIEFTRPDAAVANITFCLENGIPVVVGTTAWQDHLSAMIQLTEQQNGALLHASNFSVGVNIFFEINKLLAKLMKPQIDYIPSIEETHHLQKLDAPSGTAVTLAKDILTYTGMNSWKLGEEEQPLVNEDELAIISYRKPDVPGTHIIKYQSEIDTIEIKHEAHNRKGFALGAVLAAEYLCDKKGIYSMADVLNINHHSL
jgi:4-hydroxy-tetrahydrodipicolinate reductase